jgi:hypothetical protein
MLYFKYLTCYASFCGNQEKPAHLLGRFCPPPKLSTGFSTKMVDKKSVKIKNGLNLRESTNPDRAHKAEGDNCATGRIETSRGSK